MNSMIESLRNRVATMVKQVPDEWADAMVELRDDLTAALEAGRSGEAVLCHRLHTPGGKWQWMDGAPSQQALDDSRNFGWTLEYGYAAAPQQPPPVSTRLLAAVRAAKRERDETRLPLAPSTMGEIWLALEAIDNTPDQPPPDESPTRAGPDSVGVDPSKMLRGKVRPGGAFGIATIEVDCADLGPNTIGDGHEILIHNLTKNPLSHQQPAPSVSEAIRDVYGKVIRLLASLVTMSVSDELCERELLPRDRVMETVMRIREAMDELSALSQQEAAPSVSGDRVVQVTQSDGSTMPVFVPDVPKPAASGDGPITELTLPELTGEAERIAVNLEKRGHYLARTVMRELCRRLTTRNASVHELRICEIKHTILRKDQLYIFTVDPNCEKCRAAANAYPEGQ